MQHQEISGLEKGIEYEFRVAGINGVGRGQEAIKAYLTPEGVPTDSPKNVTTRFQTPGKSRTKLVLTQHSWCKLNAW